MDKPIQEKKYYSRFGNYATTYKGEPRIRVQFKNHVFQTSDAKTIECIEADIQRQKDLGKVPDIMTIDEHQLIEAQTVEFVIVDGEKVSTRNIKENAEEVERLKKELEKFNKKDKTK